MTFFINTNSQGDSRIDEISRLRTRSVRKTGLLGVMQDKAHISAYRSRALKIDTPRSRAQSYVSYNQAYNGDFDRKQASLRHLRVSQSSCFLLRLFRALREHISSAADASARQQRFPATAISG